MTTPYKEIIPARYAVGKFWLPSLSMDLMRRDIAMYERSSHYQMSEQSLSISSEVTWLPVAEIGWVPGPMDDDVDFKFPLRMIIRVQLRNSSSGSPGTKVVVANSSLTAISNEQVVTINTYSVKTFTIENIPWSSDSWDTFPDVWQIRAAKESGASTRTLYAKMDYGVNNPVVFQVDNA